MNWTFGFRVLIRVSLLKIGGMACSFYTETRGWAGAITIWKDNGWRRG